MSQQDDLQDDLQNELLETAYHEACHFVMGKLAKGGIPRRVSILPGPDYAGTCGGTPEMPAYAALVCLAGVFAEDVIVGGDLGRAQDDIEAAERELRQVYGDAWQSEYDRYLEFTYRLFGYIGPRRAVQAVAEYLVDNPTLELEAVYPLDDLAIRAIGKRYWWLCQQVEAFIKGGAS